MLELYDYWRSSAAYRVRITLNLKGVAYRQRAVDLMAMGQRAEGYDKIHPGRRVPALILEDGTALPQSMAILSYLDAAYPEPPLLPGLDHPAARARGEAAALTIACDIHPVNNSGLLRQIKARFGAEDAGISDWMHHWMTEGLAAFQSLIQSDTAFCFGDAPGLADVCLVPQLYNARRAGLDMTPFAQLVQVDARCAELPAFAAALPERQPDARPET